MFVFSDRQIAVFFVDKTNQGFPVSSSDFGQDQGDTAPLDVQTAKEAVDVAVCRLPRKATGPDHHLVVHDVSLLAAKITSAFEMLNGERIQRISAPNP